MAWGGGGWWWEGWCWLGGRRWGWGWGEGTVRVGVGGRGGGVGVGRAWRAGSGGWGGGGVGGVCGEVVRPQARGEGQAQGRAVQVEGRRRGTGDEDCINPGAAPGQCVGWRLGLQDDARAAGGAGQRHQLQELE
ncbi:hypothetical protein HGQ98_33420, partial [Achromobacter ruhlandii]|nr:hypothetical protein [Achromobacter ruhlandii]